MKNMSPFYKILTFLKKFWSSLFPSTTVSLCPPFTFKWSTPFLLMWSSAVIYLVHHPYWLSHTQTGNWTGLTSGLTTENAVISQYYKQGNQKTIYSNVIYFKLFCAMWSSCRWRMNGAVPLWFLQNLPWSVQNMQTLRATPELTSLSRSLSRSLCANVVRACMCVCVCVCATYGPHVMFYRL